MSADKYPSIFLRQMEAFFIYCEVRKRYYARVDRSFQSKHHTNCVCVIIERVEFYSNLVVVPFVYTGSIYVFLKMLEE